MPCGSEIIQTRCNWTGSLHRQKKSWIKRKANLVRKYLETKFVAECSRLKKRLNLF